MLQKSCMGIRSIGSINRLVDFNETTYKKFIDMLLDSTLQLTFKELPIVKFWCSIKEQPQLSEETIKTLFNCITFQLYKCTRRNFFHRIQPKPYKATDGMKQQK